MHLVWRQKITELTPVRPPLATGVLRRPRAGQPPLRVGFEDPITAGDLMGPELPRPNSPVNRVPAGLEGSAASIMVNVLPSRLTIAGIYTCGRFRVPRGCGVGVSPPPIARSTP
jgi:hypothetical protein